MATNFDLAPAPVALPGGPAVPIDIQHVDATITLDAGAATATGTASVRFVSGPVAGSPVFDLRQPVTGLRLDGAALAVTAAPHRDLGGGPGTEMRVLAATVPANTTHTLEVDYAVGLPQSPAGGSYPPRLTYAAGPSVRLSFGFTDLHPARYLEAWVPANLAFDQFSLRLTLRVTGTAVAHQVVSNATVTALGGNAWRLDFPATSTALSPLVELRTAAGLTHATTTAVLPTTGPVAVDGWQPAGGAADLAAELAKVSAWLVANETAIGPYAHGNRFVVYLDQGGMEYDGGTTSAPGPLRHEAHHSWWGRAMRPASQADGWLDEAWTVYHDNGSAGTEPFDFTDPPVTLCDRNPWGRRTPGTAYTLGERVFRGVASIMGSAPLRAAMAGFYRGSRHRPTTTAALEAHLVAVSGRPELVDAFHRFVYGHEDPAQPPELWLRDDPGDGRFWDSPDLWIRHADDGGTTHQEPEFGQDNWFHARVRNRGPGECRHFVVTFAIKGFAGTEFGYPADWLPCVAAVAGFDLAPGADTVVRARWPRHLVPPPGSHPCWLASVHSRGGHPPAGAHTADHGGLAQKNLTVVDLAPDRWWRLPFTLFRDVVPAGGALLELRRPEGAEALEAVLVHRPALKIPGAEPAAGEAGRHVVAFPPGRRATVHVPASGGPLSLALAVRARGLEGRAGTVDLVHREVTGERRVVGGLAIRLRKAGG
ncbi:hypothetical protein [Amycolatopsis sp. MtRt-6]|uniref:hypothetical protein n=1 Tax=Amycolatopsis sp. MtRt-6 TaxID=2792782 RepID=UPI001A8EC70D|nr:hypothetical protein [Amycolatopsis sp. MtRt-6]